MKELVDKVKQYWCDDCWGEFFIKAGRRIDEVSEVNYCPQCGSDQIYLPCEPEEK